MKRDNTFEVYSCESPEVSGLIVKWLLPFLMIFVVRLTKNIIKIMFFTKQLTLLLIMRQFILVNCLKKILKNGKVREISRHFGIKRLPTYSPELNLIVPKHRDMAFCKIWVVTFWRLSSKRKISHIPMLRDRYFF